MTARLYLLPPVEEIDTLDAETLPGVLAQLAALQARVAVRLTMPAPAREPRADAWLRAEAAGALIGWSTSAIRKRGHLLPGFRRLSPGRVRWSERALRDWLAAGCPEAPR